MLGWWRRHSNNAGIEPSCVAVDVHCHLLPAVDDGAANDDEALMCLHELAAMGYRGVVLTPHIYPEVFENDEDELRRHFEEFHARVQEALPERFELALGAEYMLDESLLQRLYAHPQRLLTLGSRQRWLLVELPTIALPPLLEQLLDECARCQVRPVLAHAERYAYMHEDQMKGVRVWREAEGLVQLNVSSLATRRNPAMRHAAREIARQGLVDLVGTDMHRRSQVVACRRGWKAAGRWLRGFDRSMQNSLLSESEK